MSGQEKFPDSIAPNRGYASNPREVPPLRKPTASRERSRKEKASARSGRNDNFLALRIIRAKLARNDAVRCGRNEKFFSKRASLAEVQKERRALFTVGTIFFSLAQITLNSK